MKTLSHRAIELFLYAAVSFNALFLVSETAYSDESILTGRITDTISNRPIIGVTVIVLSRQETVLAEDTTDDSGYYKIRLNHSGWVSIIIQSQAYQSVIDNNVRLIDGKGSVLDLKLDLMGDIEEVSVITIRGNNSANGSITGRVLSREDIRGAPGTAGDIFRGLSSLPGVASTGGYSNFSVRGRGPRDNIILIDGIPYDRAVHFDQSLGQQEDIGGGGRFSIFGQNVVGQAEFSPGGWGAEHGGAAGSLLNLTLAEGNRETPFYSAKFDLAGGEFLYDGPLASTEESSLLFSARYYDFGQLFGLIGADDIGTPKLADFLFKSITQLKNNKKLTLIGLYTPEKYIRNIDNVLASPSFEDPTLFESDQNAWLIAVKLDQLIGQTGNWKNTLYVRKSVDQSFQGEAFPPLGIDVASMELIPQAAKILSLKEKDWEVGLQSDFGVSNKLGRFKSGIHLSWISANYSRSAEKRYPLFIFDQGDFRPSLNQKYVVLSPDLFNTQYSKDGVQASAYLDQDHTFNNLTVKMGVRLEHNSLLSKTQVSPRALILWQANNNTTVNLTAGQYIQAPRLIDLASNNNNKLTYETTWQTSLGLKHFFSDVLQVQIEGWYQRLVNYIPENDRTTGKLSNSGSGQLAGFDFLILRHFTNQWSASFKYGYVWSKIKDDINESYHASPFSRPHLINLTMRYEFNDRWSLGLQYQLASGRPAPSYIIHDDVGGAFNLNRFSLEILDPFSNRYVNFQTLNLRVDYNRSLGGSNVIFFADIVNALGHQNTDQLVFSPITGSTNRDGLGIFPQIGLTIEF
ncbi:MAG: TonB-dependent receptor [Sphingomonadales bacterium]